jgi:phosphotransferase system enzyme I (PtsP)
MRPASIGPVKSLLRRCDLNAVRDIIHRTRDAGEMSVRSAVMDYVKAQHQH